MLNRRIFVKLSTIGTSLAIFSPRMPQLYKSDDLIPVIKVTTEFPNGGGKIMVEKTDPLVIRVIPHDQNNGGWSKIWWHFKIEGINPGSEITLFIEKGAGSSERIFYSYDDTNWALTSSGNEVSSEHSVFTKISHIVRGATVSFSYDRPYRLSELQLELLPVLENLPNIEVLDFCQSKQGRHLPAIQLNSTNSNSKYGIWLQARAHSFEAGSSWVLHELTSWLVSRDPLASNLRKIAEITILPIIDIDAIEEGRTGKNQRPYDHNRGWSHEKNHWPEVNRIKQELKDRTLKNNLDLFIDFHGPGNQRHPYFIVPMEKNLTSNWQRKNRRSFFQVLQAQSFNQMEENTQSMDQFYYSERDYDPKNHDSSNIWVGQNTTESVINLTLEVNMGTVLSTREGFRQEAITLGKAIANYFINGSHKK
ncbi:M14 family zinc carboxypeptidase [Membranihabitans maritimus]|uniref:M14 family zinc carboxypeptidase n=1 Tax=Membranihabitans maritimus TaxID=2904244 RepID=UPI001F3DFC97|nr:M14 family zinc carboxypeptidase [Membranihabitans maritimus]